MISTLIKGLGKYKVASFESLLRKIRFFSVEVMMNLNVKNVKLILKSKEATRHLLYLELGIVHARFVIKQKKISI